MSPITNQSETYYPESKRTRTRIVSLVFVMLSIAALVTLIAVIFWVQYFFTYILGGTFWSGVGSCMSGVQALLIQVASSVYGGIAVARNDAENYRTQTAYENNLIIKKFAFEVFNNYTALVITAFFKGTYFKCDGGFSGDAGNCLGDLEELLAVIFITRYALALIGAFASINDLIAYAPVVFGSRGGATGEDDDDIENDQEEPPAEAPAASRTETRRMKACSTTTRRSRARGVPSCGAPSLPRHTSSPGMTGVGGLFFDFELRAGAPDGPREHVHAGVVLTPLLGAGEVLYK